MKKISCVVALFLGFTGAVYAQDYTYDSTPVNFPGKLNIKNSETSMIKFDPPINVIARSKDFFPSESNISEVELLLTDRTTSEFRRCLSAKKAVVNGILIHASNPGSYKTVVAIDVAKINCD